MTGRPIEDELHAVLDDLEPWLPLGGLIAYRPAGEEGAHYASTCRRCRSVVLDVDRLEHERWHDRLDRRARVP